MRKHPAPDKLKVNIGRYVKATRKGAGLNQDEFGKIVGGLGRGAVSKYERGNVIPPGDVLIKMQIIFGHLKDNAQISVI